MRVLSILLLSVLPAMACASGSDTSEPPKTTKTTTECATGKIWDEKTSTCIDSDGAMLDNDTRFDAVRELAYAGRPEDALIVLSSMTEGNTDRVLTYLGFANRKAGRVDLGFKYYALALEQNPNNILARSYLGQALVERGDIALARTQLNEIRARGGEGTWAEASLALAVGTGQTANY